VSSSAKLILVAASIVVVPFTIRAANRMALTEQPGLGYLPSLELRRPHSGFDARVIDELRYAPPAWIFIGDSMLGTRIDPQYLRDISSTHDDNVAMVMAPATGPAWWFLAFKNWVVASGVRPRCTFIFFRDTNLTDTMFRLENLYGNELDRPAYEFEPELDRLVAARRHGPWARLYDGLDRVYEWNLARTWLEPWVREWYEQWTFPSPKARRVFDGRLEEALGLEHFRKDLASDLATTEAPDFHHEVASSILPDLLRLAREQHLTMCFVRVQRRPRKDKPPEQSAALGRYVADMKAWIESNGGLFHDDTGDPKMTLDLYGDGDHIANRLRYTEIFRERLDPLFRPLTRPGTP